MKVYHYNRDTKEYVCSTEATLDPLELKINKVERWLLPANATFDAPPECPEGKMIVMGDGWEIVDIPIPTEPEIIIQPESTEEQMREALIQAKMQDIIREQAISALKAEGKL